MFVTKSYHLSVVSKLEERVKSLEAAHELTIGLYQDMVRHFEEQNSDLKRLIFTPVVREIPFESREADAAITCSEKPVDMSEADYVTAIEGIREADRIFSGNYDEVVSG